jgi:rsbT co-antagonist protein RsbR
MDLRNVEARLQALTEVLAGLGLGEYEREIAAEPDALGAVEEGVNGLVLDLQTLHLANQEKADYLALQQRVLSAKEAQLSEQAAAIAAQLGTIAAQRALLDEREQQQQIMLTTIHAQSASIRELSVPIIEVEDRIVALPVIGTIDEARAREIMESVLTHVVEHRSRHVILDLTGVGAIDAATANRIAEVVRGVRLLGARCVLSGLGPTTAEALVAPDVDLRAIATFRSLKEALRDALRLDARRGGGGR